MENKELATVSTNEVWTAEQIDTIKNTVAVGANNSELKMFLSLAAKYDLDPFAREIWFANMGNRSTIITGRDGYLKIANRNPNFDGMTSDVVCSNDKFIKEGNNIRHMYSAINRGQIIGAYAVVYRKDRNTPAYFFAQFREYNKNNQVWRQYPSAMIQKVAESMALKRAFSISGLITEDEVGNGDNQQQPPQPTPEELRHKELMEKKQYLWSRYLTVCNNVKEHAINAMKKITGDKPSSQFTDDDIEALVKDVERREYEFTNTPDILDVEQNEAITEQKEEINGN